MNILHLNDKIELSGGVETYIKQLCDLAPSFGMQMYWLGFYKYHSGYSIKIASKSKQGLDNEKLINCLEYIKDFCENEAIDIIHVHSISNPELISKILNIFPVVRTMHEPRMFCPGQGKFWRKSQSTCNVKFGLKCFVYAYTQKCCNRNPISLINSYKNTKFEINANDKYKIIYVGSDYMKNEAVKVGFANDNIKILPFFTKKLMQKIFAMPQVIKLFHYYLLVDYQ